MRRVEVRWSVGVVAALCLAVGAPPLAVGAPNSRREADFPLEDPIEPLRPLRPRSEAEQDRVNALAMYAAGRMAEQRDDLPTALRLYQRAYRSDPAALEALRDIVPLAFRLGRQAEAIRYAVLRVEQDDAEPELTRRLAVFAAQEGDVERALRLYDRAVQRQVREKPSAETVALALEAGRMFYLAKRYAAAAEEFDRVSAALAKPGDFGLKPEQAQKLLGEAEITYFLFGDAYLEAGRYAEAAAAFQKSNQAKANPALLAFSEARIAARQGQTDAAQEKLRQYFQAQGRDEGTAPYELLADLLRRGGREGELVGRLESLHAADPQNVALAYYLAQRYRAARQFDKAEPIYRSLIEARKDRPPLEAFQGLVDVYFQTRQAEKLLDALGQAVERTGSLAVLGDEAQAVWSDAELARWLSRLVLERQQADPAQPGYGQRMAAAQLAIKIRDWALARRLYELALAAEPKRGPELLLGWGLDLLVAEQYAEAVRVLRKGLDEKQIPESNAGAHFFLAGALEMDHQTDAALVAARRAAELQKDSPRTASRVAWILYHAKRYDEARLAYLDLLKRYGDSQDPDDVRQTLRDARMALSNIAVTQNKLPEAEEWIEQVLDEFPEDVGAMNDLGYLWVDQQRHLGRALVMIQRAVAAEPDNVAYRDSLGWTYFRQGRYAEAVSELRQAAAGEHPDGVVLDHLGDALDKAGDKAGALATWQRALRVFEEEADAAKAADTKKKIAAAAPAG